jgi:excisionase family DNA binding protein
MALIPLDQAAKILGITPDELVEMRERNEIHGYRDGASWKFKEEEVKRVQDELSSIDVDAEFEPDNDDSSILVSEEALGESSDEATSTIIGKNQDAEAEPDSDIELGDFGELNVGDSGINLSDNLSLTGSSGINLSSGSETGSGDDLNIEPEIGTGDLDLASDLSLGSGSLDLADDDLSLGEDDSDLVLGGSGNLESDITLGAAGDTGINLLSPSDSGLSLDDEPMELGSAISSLELPEDEDDIEIGGVGTDDTLQTDDEFMLSQPDEMGDDDDSGSQVIALEESSAFDQDAATMLQSGEEALLSEDPAFQAAGPAAAAGMALDALNQADASAGFGEVAQVGGAAAAAAEMPMPAAPTVIEAPYTLLNVLGLLCIVLCLTMAGLLMVDIARNMWAWEEGMSVSTSMTDGIISVLGLDD